MKISELLTESNINEGGNIFKDTPTVRINREHVVPTVKWLEKYTGLPLVDNMMGSTGRKPTSGDLDLAVDVNNISKDELVSRLQALAGKIGLDPKTSVVKSGISVHFYTPISGSEGYVQTDFMFMPDVEWGKFQMSGDSGKFTGADRARVLASIAKSRGFKITGAGMMARESGKFFSKDLDDIARALLGPGASGDDICGVETMVSALRTSKDSDAKTILAQAAESLSQYNVNILESKRKSLIIEKEGGMSDKERKAYNRKNGSNLKRAQPGGGKRRTSYCARSKGQMDMHDIDCRTDPDKPICKARRDWNC